LDDDSGIRGAFLRDFGAKPDLCAAGAGIVSLADYGSTLYQAGFAATPSWLVGGVLGNPFVKAPYLSLSGTSMATPFVSGAVALMLQANPNLTPNLIKAILEYTARFQPNVSPLRQGAGFMNVAGALALATAYKDVPASTVSRSTAKSASAVKKMKIPNTWSKRVLWGNHMLAGGIINPYGNAWTPGVVWGSAKTQMSIGDNIVWGTACPGECDNIVWGTASNGDNIVWGTANMGDNIVWGTAAMGDNIVWGTATMADNIVWGTADIDDNIVWGTAFSSDNIVWGTAIGDGNVLWGTDCGGDDCDVV